MSVTTTLKLYSTTMHLEMREMTRQLLGVFGNPEQCDWIWRVEEERGWAEFLADRDDFQPIKPVETDWEQFDETVSAEQLIARFPVAAWANISLLDAGIGETLSQEISESIPPALRLECVPCQVSIQIGWHDVWECAIESAGQYIARAFVSIDFFSYGTPADPEPFLTAIHALPAFCEVKQRLEFVTGPLQSTLIMHV